MLPRGFFTTSWTKLLYTSPNSIPKARIGAIIPRLIQTIWKAQMELWNHYTTSAEHPTTSLLVRLHDKKQEYSSEKGTRRRNSTLAMSERHATTKKGLQGYKMLDTVEKTPIKTNHHLNLSLSPTESSAQVAVLQYDRQLLWGIPKKNGPVEHHLRDHSRRVLFRENLSFPEGG